MDIVTARARIHAMFTAPDDAAVDELDRRIDDLLAISNARTDDGKSFFQPGHLYASRSGGRERFRFLCESVTTDSETGNPRALGQHGRRGTADGEWIWTPNPRTYDDWRSGAWNDITD
ncbi:hypothetical protein [Streptomyces sp. NBC_01483]|uniref:hypothetical protein n=1 Tax=Streptomyces sp. NBC_01483 TaxID=2903883 RepID=UPI002E353A86|nr:hypothetical protein [Streptomyces sp. NBC_01483]